VPLDPELPRRRLERIAENAGLSLLLVARPLSSPLAAAVPCLDIREMREHPAGAPPEEAEPAGLDSQSAAWIIYTSGSTGQQGRGGLPWRRRQLPALGPTLLP